MPPINRVMPQTRRWERHTGPRDDHDPPITTGSGHDRPPREPPRRLPEIISTRPSKIRSADDDRDASRRRDVKSILPKPGR
jgi:hypothetical protein